MSPLVLQDRAPKRLDVAPRLLVTRRVTRCENKNLKKAPVYLRSFPW